MRISEAAKLTISDIDSKEMVICIHQGKRKKDRYVPLSTRLLKILRAYWRDYRPQYWLFSGRDERKPIPVRTLQSAFTQAKENANIQKNVTIHGLLHAFATHLLNSGTEPIHIKQLLGHSSLTTTLRYTRISKQMISRIQSPFDRRC